MDDHRTAIPKLPGISPALLSARFGCKVPALCAILLLSLALIIPSTVLSQTLHERKLRPGAIPIVPAQSLDFTRGRLPSRFVPADPAALYEAARRTLISPEKSEFETTAQYQARIGVLIQKALWRGLKASDEFAFVLRPGPHSISGHLEQRDEFVNLLRSGFVATKYDADSQHMSVSIPTDAGEPGSDYSWVSAIHRSVAYGAPYVGENAFGVQGLIRRIRTDTLELDVEDYDWLSPNCTDDGTDKVFSLTVDPTEARALSEDIEVIMIGELHAPFVSHSVDGYGPSLENLRSLTSVHHLLHISLDQLVIADGRTGAILKQFSRQKHLAEFPLRVEFRGQDVPFSDRRCEDDAYLFSFDTLSIQYSIDGGEEQLALLDKPLRIEARRYVDVSITYCNIPRVRAFVDGRPHALSCEYQDQYIANDSKCARIQVGSKGPAPAGRTSK